MQWHEQETGRGREIKGQEREGPKREGIDAGKEGHSVAQNNLQKLDPKEVEKVAEGLRDGVKHEVGGQFIDTASKETPDQTPVQQYIDGDSKEKMI
ncbi:MAG: hypothetical protein PV340_01035 [Wolbachia sp.]|nr:hypothetical protein [Wolbachia sp.]MDD9336444.1 hypothetical protein [Wolbachia sp.]